MDLQNRSARPGTCSLAGLSRGPKDKQLIGVEEINDVTYLRLTRPDPEDDDEEPEPE